MIDFAELPRGDAGWPQLQAESLAKVLVHCPTNRTVSVVESETSRSRFVITHEQVAPLASLFEVNPGDIRQITYKPNHNPWDDGNTYNLLDVSIDGTAYTFELV